MAILLIFEYFNKKSPYVLRTFFVWYFRRESRLWRRAPMNSGCPLFSLPVYGCYQLAFLANRSLPLASPPSISAVLFCAYANKKARIFYGLFLFGTPGGNRTHNGPLGGGCYIHLTTEAYWILISRRFPPRRISAAFRKRNSSQMFMNEVHTRVRSLAAQNNYCDLQRKYNTIYRKKNQSIFCPFWLK